MAHNKSKKAYTLIELITVIVIIGIISATGAIFFAPLINLSFFTPRQTEVELVGNFIKDNILEGYNNGWGLRNITSIESANATQIVYYDANSRRINLYWDNTSKKFFRATPTTTSILPFENPQSTVLIDGQAPGKLFTYYDTNQHELSSPVSNPSLIARIEFNWIVYSQTTPISKYLINSGVFIKQF